MEWSRANGRLKKRVSVRTLSTAGAMLSALFIVLLGSLFPQKVNAYYQFDYLYNTGGTSPRGTTCDTYNGWGIPNGTYVTAALYKGSMGDPYLYVFDRYGNVVTYNDDGAGNLNSYLGVTWYDGYYIGVSTYGWEGTGRSYGLSVSTGYFARGYTPCNKPPKSNQSISFGTPSARTFVPGGTFTVSASASSGLPVSFSSSTTSVCTTGGSYGSTITMQGAGVCTITASQGGDASWNAASSVTQSFWINKANQSITFGALSNRTYSPTAFTVSASSSAGLSVSFTSQTTSICTVSGTSVTMVSSGTCTIRASQAGNTNYNAASVVDQSFVIAKANQTITFANPGTGTTRRYNSNFTASATSDSGLAVTISSRTTSTCTTSGTNGTTISLINTGTCTLRTTQVGDGRYNAATDVDQSFTVDKALQTITFTVPTARTYGDANFNTVATSSSGLTVSFDSVTPSTCSVSGVSVSILGAGTCTLRASQSGSALFESATDVDRDFTINRKTLTAPSASVASRVYNGSTTAGAVNVGTITGLVGNETLIVSGSGSNYSSQNVTPNGLDFYVVNRNSSTYASGKGVVINASTPGLCYSGTKTAINDVWGDGVIPAPNCNENYFTSYREGSIVSPVTGVVTFYASTDDGFYMTINGTPVIDTWQNQAPASYNDQGTFSMVAGQAYSIKVWHFENSAGAAARLFWSYAGQAVQVVPSSAFYRGAATTISFSLADGSNGGRANNYQLASVPSTGVVTPRPLTVTALNVTRTTSEALPAFSVTTDGLAPGESLADVSPVTYNFRLASSSGSYTTTTPNPDVVSTYTVLPSAAVLANSRPLSNYTVTYQPGVYTINLGEAAKVSVPAFNSSTARVSGSPFGTQPIVTVQDAKNNTITSGDASTAVITATITAGTGGELIGTTTATAVQGVARFTNLGILGLTSQTYTITYTATYGPENDVTTVAGVATQTVSLTHGPASQLRVLRDADGARSAIAFITQPQVEVLDVKGNRVTTGTSASAAVTVSLTGSGATLSGTATRTASSGVVTFSGLTLSGTAAETGYDLVFASPGLTSTTQEDLVLSAGNAARLTLLTPSQGTASGVQFTTAPQIAVLDGQGNRVTNVPTTVTATLTRVNNTGALVNGVSATTDTATTSNGVATFSELGISGLQNTSYAITYSATVNGVVLTAARQDITVTVGPPSSLRVDTAAAGATSRVALTTQPKLTILDSGGNVVVDSAMQGDITVTAKKSTDATVSAVVSNGAPPAVAEATTGSGIAQFENLTLQGEATTYTLTYSFDNGTQSFSTTGSVALAAGPASKLTLERPSSTSVAAGTAFGTQPIVRITDADNNLISTSSAPITVSLSGDGTLGGTSTVNAVGGRAVFSGLNIRGSVGEYTLSFSTTQQGLSSVAQPSSVSVTHGTANKVVVANASAVAAGTAQSGQAFGVDPIVQVQDAWGNKVTTGNWSTATISATSTTGSTRVGTTSGAATAGEITFETLGLRGVAGTTYSVTYTATYTPPTGSSSTIATTGSHNATVSAGPVTKVRLLRSSAGNASDAAFATQPQVELLDADNNRVTTAGVTIKATLTSTTYGTLIAGTDEAITDNTGVATFSGLGIKGEAGRTFSIGYRDASATLTGVNQSVTLAAGSPTALRMVTSSSITLASGSTFSSPPVVRVVDSYGNAVSSNTVVIAAELVTGENFSSGTVIGTTTRTTSNGSATFTGLGIRGVIGSYKLRFTATDLTAVEQTSNVTLTHGPAAVLAVTNTSALEAGSNVAASGAAFTTQPVIEVRDVSGNKVEDSSVTVSVSVSTGGSLIESVTADADSGVATFSGVGINGRDGATYTMTYRATVGFTALTPATHNVTASTGAAKKLTLTQPAVGTASSVVFTTQPQVRLLDSGNNIVAMENTTITASITQVSNKGELFPGGSLSATTNAQGIATFSGIGIRGVAGQSYVVTYASNGLTSTTQSIRVSPGIAADTTLTKPTAFSATGGTTTDVTVNGEKWRVHTFTTTGSSEFVVPSGVPTTDVEYLIVGGGGGGGFDGAGGGGGGQVRTGSLSLGAGTHTVSVGAGGAAATTVSSTASNGQQSVFAAVTAIGGGGGGSKNSNGANGGSGGGGGHASGQTGGSATGADSANGIYGNSGGSSSSTGGGGGGGAGSSGSDAGTNGGNGGAGIASSITGTEAYYGGGGAGGNFQNNGGTGGIGGGGDGGGADSNGRSGQSGSANTGGGGGANGNIMSNPVPTAGSGGSGVVIVRYRLTDQTGQSGVALDPQPTVRVTDADGNLVDTSDALVSVAVTRKSSTGNDGSLVGATQVRAVNGIATFSDLAILGTADRDYDLTFTIEGQNDPTVMTVRLQPGDPASLQIANSPSTQVSGTAANVSFTTAPQIRLLDSMGNITKRDGVTVNVSISAGGVVGGTTFGTTNADGIATLSAFTVGARAGTYTLTFTSTGLQPTSHTFNAVAGPASQIVIDDSVATITAASGVQFNIDGAVRIADAAGNTVNSNSQITATSSSGELRNAGTGSGSSVSVAASAGVVPLNRFSLTGIAGEYTVTYTGSGLTSASHTISLSAGAPSQVAVSSTVIAGSSAVASGTSLSVQPRIAIKDSAGNAVVSANTSDGLNLYAKKFTSGTVRNTSNQVDLSSDNCFSGNVPNIDYDFSARSPSQISLEADCGAANNLDYYVTNFQGQLVAPVDGVVTFYSSSDDGFVLKLNGVTVIDDWEDQGSATYNSDRTNDQPVSSRNVTMKQGQVFDLQAWHYDYEVGSVARLYWSYEGQTTPVIVPASAFVVPQVTATITAAPQGATAGTPSVNGGTYALTGTTTANVVSGVASFSNLGITGPVGTYTITYSWGSLTQTQNVTVAPGTQSALVASAPTTARAGERLTSPVVRVVDSAGNTVTSSTAGINVSVIGSNAGNVVLRGTAARGAVNGTATFNDLSLNGTVGDYTLTFSIAGGALYPQDKTVSLAAGAPAQIDVVAMDSASSKKSGELLNAQPSVRLKDAYGNIVLTQPSVRVELEQVNVNGATTGTLTNSDVDSSVRKTLVTDSSTGLATFEGIAINGVDGQRYRLSLTADGVSPVVRTFTITTGDPIALRLDRSGDEEPRVGIAMQQQPQVAVVDSGGNIVDTINDVALNNLDVTASVEAGATVLDTNDAHKAQTVSGVATFTGLTLNGTATINGTQYVVTYSGSYNGSALESATQTVTLYPGNVDGVSVNAIDTRAFGDAFSDKPFETTPVVRVVDSSTNTVASQPATVTASITNCSGPTTLECQEARLVGTVSRALEDGVATFTGLGVRGKIGTYTITYTTTIGASSFSTFHTVALEGGDPARMSVDNSSITVAVGETINPVVTFLDTAGNPATTDKTVTASVTQIEIAAALTGQLRGTATESATSGVADFDGNGLNLVGVSGQTYTVTYSATALPELTQQVMLTPGAPDSMLVEVAPAGASSGATLLVQPRIRLLDVGGNNAAGTPSVSVAVTSAPNGTVAGQALSGTASVNAGNGLATFSGLSLAGKVGTYRLEFTATGVSAQTADVVLAPGAPSALTVTQAPTTVTSPSPSGSPFETQPIVAVTDAQGNTITSAIGSISVAITSGANGSLVGTTSAFVEDGVATFNDLGISGRAANNPYTFTFTHSATNLTTTQAVHVAAGPAAQLLLTPQSMLTEGTPLKRLVGVPFSEQQQVGGTVPTVTVADSGGNTVTTSNAVITATVSNGAELIGTTTVTAVSGIAEFTDLGFIGTAGQSYTVTFETANLASASETIPAEVGPPTKLGITRAGQRAKTGAPLITQPQIQLLDAGNNAVSKPNVDVAVSASGGTLSGTRTITTNANGRADFSDLSLLGTLGTEYRLTYVAEGVTSVQHDVRVEIGDPYKLALSQEPVGADAGAPSATQPIVVIQDFGGNIVGTATNAVTTSISRTTNNGAGSLHAGSVIGINPTTRSGVAEFTGFGIVGTAGETYRVTFAAQGLQSVTHDLLAAVGPASQITIDTDTTGLVAPAGDPIATSIAVSIRDAGGNIVSSSSDITATISSGSSVTGTTTVAASNGTATFSDLRVVGIAGQSPTVTFTVLGVGSATMSPAIETGSASQLVPRVALRSSPSGATYSAIVDVRDAGGNLVTAGSAATATITASLTQVDVNEVATGAFVPGTTTSGVANGGTRTFTLGLDGTVGVQYDVTYTATIGSGNDERTLTGTEKVTVTEGAPVSIALTTDAQGTASGAAFTRQPVITVYDSGGNVVTGSQLRVKADISAGPQDGVLEGTKIASFVNGVARFSSLGISGTSGETYTVRYQVIEAGAETAVAGIVPMSEDVTVSVGQATNIQFVDQIADVVSGQSFGTQPVIRVIDSGGNTVTSSSATITATINVASDNSHTTTLSGSLTASGTNETSVSVDAVDGVARFDAMGIRGKDDVFYTIKFAVTANGPTANVSQDITPIGGTPASLAMKHRDGQVAGFKQSVPSGAAMPLQPLIHIRDAEGNISVGSSARVVASITQVDISGQLTGQLLGTTAVSAVRGVATFTDLGVTGTAGQDYVITYTVDGVPVQTESVTVAVGAPTQLRISRGAAGASAGIALATQPHVQILDSGNNLTTSNANVTVAITQVTVGGQATGELLGTTTRAASSGVATFNNIAVGGIAGTSYTLTYSASVDGTDLQSATEAITPTPGTPVSAAIVRAANEAVIDEAFVTQPVIAVKDVYGNVVTNSSDVVTMTVSAGGTLLGQTSRRAVDGRVEFSGIGLRGAVGNVYTLSYGLSGYQPQTQTIRLYSGAANRLAISRLASGAASGAAFNVAPQISVKDAKGNLVFDSTMEITATVRQVGGTGQLVGNRTVSAIDGVATFADLGLTGLAGTSYEITFEAVGMLPDSQSIAVTVGAPTTVDLLRTSIGTAAAEPFTQQPQVVLRDSGGNTVPVTGTAVSATVSTGTNLVGTTSASTVGGVATFNNLGISGATGTNYTMTYSVEGVNDTATQTGTVTVGSPRVLLLTRPAGGTTVGALFTVQPQVTVLDGAGNTVTASTAPITATIAGTGGGLTGTTTRSAVQGVATFVNLGLTGTAGEQYVVTYASPGLVSVTQSITATPAQAGLVSTFGVPTSTVDGFRVEITNYDPDFTYSATATNGARAMVTTSLTSAETSVASAPSAYAIVSGLDGDVPSTVTVTSSRDTYTTVTASVQGRSLKRPALNPQYGTLTPTVDGFSVQITNYNPSYIWVVSLPTGARATISVSGVMRVTGVAAGTEVSATVSTTRPGYEDGRSTTPAVTTLLAGRTPTFGSITRTNEGFTVPIINYDATWTWSATATGGADVTISDSGVVTVASLTAGAESTVLVKTARDGYNVGSASVTARSISAARTPEFGVEVPTATGWTVPISNYDSAFTWAATTSHGQVSITATSATAANLVIANVPDDVRAEITVTTSRDGFRSGSAVKRLTRASGLLARFGNPTSTQTTITLPIENYDADYTWSVTATRGTAAIVTRENEGVVTAEVRVTNVTAATAVTMTVRTSRFGFTAKEASYTYGTLDAQDSLTYLPAATAPTFGAVSRTADGFVVTITNFASLGNDEQLTVQSTDGDVSRVDDVITVTGLNPSISADVVVSVNASGKRTAVERTTGTALPGPALVPIVSTPQSTADGFTFNIENYSSDFFYLASATSGTATVSSTGVVTVTGLNPGASTRATVTASRSGYDEGVTEVDGSTTRGRALVPVFGLPRAITDGFVVPITNYTTEAALTWSQTSSSGVITRVDETVTVTGLTAGQSATITVETEHTNREDGSAQYTFAALGEDGVTPGLAQALAPTFGPVTRTITQTQSGISYGFTVPITNFNAAFTWSAISAAGATTSINETTGVLTVTGLDASETDDVVVVTNKTGYATGNARVTATALAEGEREENLLTDFAMGAICTTGSPEGYGVAKINDLNDGSSYACFVNDSRNIGAYTASSVGFYTSDISSVVVDRITFTSSRSASEHDPITYSLWGCAEENRFCTAIVTNDITNLSTTRGQDSVRNIRNTRAFRYYKLTFGSVRGTTHSVNIGEVAFGGRSAEQPALTPRLGTATVTSSGLQMQISNYSSLYNWNAQVASPGVVNISTSGLITVSNLPPSSGAELTVTTTRPGFATGTTSYSFTTTLGAELRPVLSRPVLTADGARIRIENYNTSGYNWVASLQDCSTLSDGDPTVPISANGLMIITGHSAGEQLQLSVCTSRTHYQGGKAEVAFTIPQAGHVAQFATPTRTDDGYNVQITNFDTEYSWSVRANNGASVLLENNGLVRVSNLGAGQSSTLTVTTTRSGHSNGVATLTASAIDAGLVPQFSSTRVNAGGYEFTISNYDPEFTWGIVENNSAATSLDSVTGVVTVTTANPETSYVTVTTTQSGYQEGSASIGAGLLDALVPEFDEDNAAVSETGATIAITNFDPAFNWTVALVPSGRATIDQTTGVVTISGASPGTDVTLVATTTRTGYATGRTPVVIRTTQRAGLMPALAAPIRLVGGFSVDITNFDAVYTWSATSTAGTVTIIDNTVLVTDLTPAQSATVTVTTARGGHANGSLDVTSSALPSPAVVPEFGTPTSTLGGFTTQITNYNAALTWTASVSQDGTAAISSTGLVTVTGLAGLTTAELMVTTESPTHLTGRASTTGTSLVNPALTPRFGLTESTTDGFRVRISNYDPRWTWTYTVSGAESSNVVIGEDGWIVVSGITGVRYITVTVKSDRAGYTTGASDVSSYSLPEPRITLGAQSVTHFAVDDVGQDRVATLTTSSAHGFEAGDIIVVTGVSDLLDGEQTITAVTVLGDDGATAHTLSFTTNAPTVTQTELTPTGSVRLLDDINLEVLMTAIDAPIVVRAQVNIPYSTADSGTQFTATTMMSEVIDAGYRVLRVRAESETEGRISALNVPIRILFDPPAEGAVPVYSGDGGETWRVLELLDTPYLPDDKEDGYFVSADGRVWVFTRHLSIFGLLARQAVPITVSSTAPSMTVGDIATISVTGGEGEGEVTARSLTPEICSLSEDNDITALRAGDCVIEGKKAAFDRFIEATGTLTVAVSDPPVVTPVVDTPADSSAKDATKKTKTRKKTSKDSGQSATGGSGSIDQPTDDTTTIDDGKGSGGDDTDKGAIDENQSADGGGRNFSFRWIFFGLIAILLLLGAAGGAMRYRRKTL